MQHLLHDFEEKKQGENSLVAVEK